MPLLFKKLGFHAISPEKVVLNNIIIGTFPPEAYLRASPGILRI